MTTIQDQLARAEATLAQRQQAATAAENAVAAAQEAVTEAETPQARIIAQRVLVRASAAQKAAEDQLASAQAAVNTLRELLPFNPPVSLGDVSGDVPLVLLPVRLETRYQVVNGVTDLLIRIYPDDLHIDTHEVALTAEEAQWGRRYWEDTWRGGDSDANERLAWTRIADAFSPERAAWIVRMLTPTNPAARPHTPIAADAALPTAPVFPAVETRLAAQTRAPLAQLLPDFWVALAYNDRGRVITATTTAVRQPLAAGPEPDTREQPPAGVTGSPVDAGMKWLVDFNEAIAAGMALRMHMPASQARGFTRLVVTGIRSSLAPDVSARQLATLLEAQHYTRGLEVLRRGTPTNNSTTSRSGFGGEDVGHAASFAVERGPALATAGDAGRGSALATALGVKAEVFAHVAGSDNHEGTLERDVNTVLWPSTVGYFLDQRLRGVAIDAELRTLRRHFIDFVRGGGPLSAIRFGRQPYGVLPVTSLDLWAAGVTGNGPASRAIGALLALREAFRRAQGAVPRLGVGDIDQALVAVLQMQPVSSGFRVRPMLGATFVENYSALLGIDTNATWWQAQTELAKPTLAIPGLPAVTPQGTSVASALVRSLPNTLALARTSQYTAQIAAAGVQQLRADVVAADDQRTLFERLARHGLLLEYSLAARRLSPQATPLMTDELEPELVDIGTRPTVTLWRRLTATLVGLNPALEIGAYLDKPESERDPAVTDLAAVRQALKNLAGVDGSTLDRLLRETLDVASHRLDAWITSLATSQLAALRQASPDRIVVGAYGWVENVAPSSARTSDGYLQGPSPDHAATAAMLASGFLSHRADAASAFAIGLSSKRVQQARQLLEGVRRGVSPAALLGYRVERLLHEGELDAFVQPFRALAPLDADGGTRNVCNGATLLDLWRTRTTDPRFRQVVPPSASAAQAIDRVFTRLDDEVDALSDVLLSESVFQVGRGKRNNLVTSFDGLIRGESYTEAEILNTPRHGAAFLHRIVVPLPDTPVASPWVVGKDRARAVAEPRLNAWLGRMLGDPRRVTWSIRAGGTSTMADLSQLGLAPIDVVAMNAREFASVLAAHARRVAGDGAVVERTPASPSSDSSGHLTLDEFEGLVESARQAVGQATALMPANLALPEDQALAVVDIEELRKRADAAVAALEAAAAGLTEATRDVAGQFGVVLDTPEGASLPLTTIADELTRRVAQAEAVLASPPADAVEREKARFAAVFGTHFVVLPRFTPKNALELTNAWAASAAVQGGDPDAAHTWLSRQSMVRAGAGSLADLGRLRRLLDPNSGDEGMTVAQLPFTPQDRWIALPFVPGQSIAGRRLSLVSWGTVPNVDAPVAGLLIDEWTERVPSPTETTGLAFHFDEPEARAPQAILIAVAPDASKPWTLETLESVLLETLELSQLRLVDADARGELDHYLPATYVAMNTANEAVSTDL